MSTRFTVRHIFNVDSDTYWKEIFFNNEFNKNLYLERLKFAGYEILEDTDEGGGVRTRKVRATPATEAPRVVKKLIGDSLSYLEAGRFDPERERWIFTITPSKLSEKITITGEFWVEARGEKQVERISTIDLEVRIFGVGRAVEAFIEKSTVDDYERASVETQKYIAEEGL